MSLVRASAVTSATAFPVSCTVDHRDAQGNQVACPGYSEAVFVMDERDQLPPGWVATELGALSPKGRLHAVIPAGYELADMEYVEAIHDWVAEYIKAMTDETNEPITETEPTSDPGTETPEPDEASEDDPSIGHEPVEEGK